MTVYEAIMAVEALQQAQKTLQKASSQVNSITLAAILNTQAQTIEEAKDSLGNKRVS